LENYSILNEQISRVLPNKLFNNTKLQQLKNCTLLLSNSELPNETEFSSIFNGEDNGKILQFYKWKENPPYKNPTKAAILSAILPGLGKIYTNEVGDGITSFVLTGLFSYLAINKFSNNQQTSALIYTALATFFYSGNIYGSYASAQNYNAGIKFNFENEVKIFVNDRNQFLPIPKFLSD
jgi:TM2 domain-containing membrane protein YozV